MIVGALALVGVGDWLVVRSGVPLLRPGVPWWVGALAVLVLAAWLADRGVARDDRVRWTRTDGWAVLVVCAVAAVYRLWAIGRYPPPALFGFEEFQTGGLAYGILQDWWDVPLEFPLTNLLPALSFRVCGLSSSALRLPFILSSIVAPLFLYLALRRVVQRPAAWAGAMLLATNRWAALAARFADEIFLPIAFVALAAWLFVRVLQDRRRALSAVAFALVSSDFFYAYSGYRALPFIAFAGAAWLALWRYRRRRAGAAPLRACALVLAVWAATLSPAVSAGWSRGSSSFFEALERHDATWGSHRPLAERVATAATRLRQGWAVFTFLGDELPTLNIPEEPMLDPVSAALVTLGVLAALWRWRQPSRWLALAMVGIPFLALALIPLNFNVSRYFVLLVPLFFLGGCWLDDLCRWLGKAGPVTLAVVVALVAGFNFVNLLRVIDSPVVQAGFQYPENTVLAAIHAVPAGSRVVLLTAEGANAFEPSDYRWYAAHAHGGRPTSLEAALAVPATPSEPVYWITQGLPEARLLPKLVALSCPQATSTVVEAPTSDATVGVSWIESGAGCRALPPFGLRGRYHTVAQGGDARELQQVDPALCAYTIPWPLGWKMQDRQLQSLQVRWEGHGIGTVPGQYEVRLEMKGASGQLRVGDMETQVVAPAETWASASVSTRLDAAPVPLIVQLEARPGELPRARLYWTPPGGTEELIPPTQLRPAPN